jgi:hypothetical protein
MKNYSYLLLSLAALTSTTYAAVQTSRSETIDKNVIQSNKKDASVAKKEIIPNEKDDAFSLGKIVALNEKSLEKNAAFTHLKNLPSWNTDEGSPMWLTKPGAKVIVPLSNGTYVYGVVQALTRDTITIIIKKKADNSFEVADFPRNNLGIFKWVHIRWITESKTWLTKKTKLILINREKAFVNYNPVTKKFDPLAL